jgi:4-hydroxy-3-methylbut-2-enyl diphosphate reductase
MEVIVTPHSGFCSGVKRAVELASQATREKGKVYSLGPIIHNSQVIEGLQKEGVEVIHSLDQISEGTIIIRSHGVPPSIMRLCAKKQLNVVDATCPIVQRAQNMAQLLHNDGYLVIIVGDRNHYEVKSLLGFAGRGARVVENLEGLKKIKGKKLGIISQTTQSVDNFCKVVAMAAATAKEVRAFNTICEAMQSRQEETAALSREVDLMFIIGGLESANTKRLSQISREAPCQTYQIEEAAEIERDWLNGKKRIGVSAGASTPDWIIEEVLDKLKKLGSGVQRFKGVKG